MFSGGGGDGGRVRSEWVWGEMGMMGTKWWKIERKIFSDYVAIVTTFFEARGNFTKAIRQHAKTRLSQVCYARGFRIDTFSSLICCWWSFGIMFWKISQKGRVGTVISKKNWKVKADCDNIYSLHSSAVSHNILKMQRPLTRYTQCGSLTLLFTVVVLMISQVSTALTTFGVNKPHNASSHAPTLPR